MWSSCVTDVLSRSTETETQQQGDLVNPLMETNMASLWDCTCI